MAGTYKATWVRGSEGFGPQVERSGKPDDAYLRLEWLPDAQGRAGSGWALQTDALTLDELVKIAASLAPVK